MNADPAAQTKPVPESEQAEAATPPAVPESPAESSPPGGEPPVTTDTAAASAAPAAPVVAETPAAPTVATDRRDSEPTTGDDAVVAAEATETILEKATGTEPTPAAPVADAAAPAPVEPIAPLDVPSEEPAVETPAAEAVAPPAEVVPTPPAPVEEPTPPETLEAVPAPPPPPPEPTAEAAPAAAEVPAEPPAPAPALTEPPPTAAAPATEVAPPDQKSVASAKEALLKSAIPAEKEPEVVVTAEVAPAGDLPPEEQLDEALTAQLEAAMSADASAAPAQPTAEGEAPAAGAVPASAETAVEVGKRYKVTLASIGEEEVFVEIAGVRNPGVIPKKQFTSGKIPDVGTTLEAIVDNVGGDDETVTLGLPRAKRKLGGNWEAVAVGQVVDANVTKANKGGLEVQISGLRGFLPASQVEFGFVDKLDDYVGQTVTVKILEVNPEKRNLIVSRKAHLADERAEKSKEVWEELAVGQTLDGTVKTIKDYGAFVDLGGVDGFLHVGEISWNRIASPSEILSVGQQIAVKVLKIDAEAQKIGLGMKQLISNPWDDAADRYPIGSTASGKVTRTTDFGAFVQLEQGVEGLVHISELDYRRVGAVTEVVSEGEQVDVKILQVEPNRKRIALSIKQLKEKPQSSRPEPQEQFVPEPEPYKRKRKGQLRGGRSQGSGGGGMFGNPDDFR